MNAANYPIWKVYTEGELIVDRRNKEAADHHILLNLAVSAVISKKANTAFQKRIDKLRGQKH